MLALNVHHFLPRIVFRSAQAEGDYAFTLNILKNFCKFSKEKQR
jgi:hypothetical protein